MNEAVDDADENTTGTMELGTDDVVALAPGDGLPIADNV